MNAILISINPKWVVKILNGEKKLEIRKTMPKCDLPIDVYIYCTKNGEVFKNASGQYLSYKNRSQCAYKGRLSNGVVVAKFTLNKVEKIEYQGDFPYHYEELLKKSCLEMAEFRTYLFLDGKFGGYAWHIDNLVILDKPKELSEFKSYKKNIVNTKINGMVFETELDNSLIKAPQSWCYVEVEDEE